MKYFKVKIIGHTPLTFEDKKEDLFHKDLIGKIKLVRNHRPGSAFFECKTGESILKIDCEVLNKQIKDKYPKSIS